MPIIDGVYHSETPKTLMSNKFSLSEVNELIPGVKAKVEMLIRYGNHDDFSRAQRAIIDDMRTGAGIYPKDVYISSDEAKDIPGVPHEIDLATYMMATGLNVAINPDLPIEVSYRGPNTERKRTKKGTGAKAHEKSGFLWD